MDDTKPHTGGYSPRAGKDFARTWATAHGSAWVLASDLMEWPGIFATYAKFQVIERAMERCGLKPERMPYDNRAFMYRMSPDQVKEVLYGTEA